MIYQKLQKSEKGVITLVISILILLLCTLVVFAISKSILLEQKISNNDFRSKQAFEAAEAGLLAALEYMGDDPDRDGNGIADPSIFSIDATANNIGTLNMTTVGVASVEVTIVPTSVLTSTGIISQGFSDDRTATRTVTQTSSIIDPLPSYPRAPFVTRGALVVGGSATIYNMEGNSTIWSGGDTDLGSNSSTATYIADPTDAGYPSCLETPLTCAYVESSNRLTPSLDVVEQDTNLATLGEDEFFFEFFGATPANYEASRVTIPATPGTVGSVADLANYEVIWINGDTTFSGLTVGCTVSVTGNQRCGNTSPGPGGEMKPSIVIVDGDATFSGTNQFYGILYVRGDIDFIGNTTVYGAVVVEGTANQTSGSMDVYYNSDMLGNLERAGKITGKAGAWRDF